MGIFWNRKKKDEGEGEAKKSGFFSRLLGRDAGESPEAEPMPEPPQPVEALPEAPAPSIVPAPVPEVVEVAEKPGFFGRLFNRGEAPPVESSVPPPPVVTESVVAEAAPVEDAAAPVKTGFFKKLFKGDEAAPEPTPAEPETEEVVKKRFFLRFKKAVTRTQQNLVGRLDTLLRGKKTISPEVLDELEEILIGADIGVQTTLDLVDTIRKEVSRKQLNDVDELKRRLKSELLGILKSPPPKRTFKSVASETEVDASIRPYVMMMVGVNGVGKTTTIAKLANLIKREGADVMICAADTFRAAASDQLAVWAERTDVPLIQQKPGTDPAAVVFDALAAAKARDADVLIVDTAGRLHTKSNLMQELEKMCRIAGREVSEAPHEVLLVLDAATGQNGLEQARQFTKSVNVTGIVLTKLDGTAKGGIVVAISKELGVPIRYVGIGEQLDDLVVFSPDDYVNSLFE